MAPGPAVALVRPDRRLGILHVGHLVSPAPVDAFMLQT